MINEYYVNARSSCLRRYVGLRVNLFRAMHDKRFYFADDRTVMAARCGEFAITACVAYDQVFSYYYIRDCGWYRSDLSKLCDEEVPEHVQHDLLRQFVALLG
ncbi:MAG TPA: hypothetical protein VEB21_15855 [Terriglobales bacterium]|nr:hypothetical protein [Terriglobales bacterium]